MSTMVLRMDLTSAALSVPAARHAVRAVLGSWGIESYYEIELVVSELVGNAVRHAGTETTLELEIAYSAPSVRVSVADGSSVRPMIRELQPENETGRGMYLVQALSERWGTEHHRGGKRVWVELTVP